jgi:hypothetical protein
MADLSPIMTLFREWEAKFSESADQTKTTDKQSDLLLDQCRAIENQMIPLPASSASDFAAKVIVVTGYGGFAPTDDLLAEAKALAAGRPLEHPDAKLIEFGRQFEAAKAKALPLDREHKALFAAAEKAISEAGIPEGFADRTVEQDRLARKIEQDKDRRASYAAFTKAHSECVRLMKAIHRTKATTLEGFAVKAAAVAFDQSDFEVSDPVPSDVAERELYRLARDMAKVVRAKAGGAHG